MELFNVICDDWEGLYIDGRLVYQGHSIPMWVAVEAIAARTPVDSVEFESAEVDPEWMEDRPDLPDALVEVVLMRTD